MGKQSEEEAYLVETEDGYYFGDFYFSKNGILIRTEGIEGIEVNIIDDLMELHRRFHKKISESKYVPAGSILGCTYGTILARMGSKESSAVYVGNGAPVMTCSDCESGTNIPSFGTCNCPAIIRASMPRRKDGVFGQANGPSGAAFTPEGTKCVPLIKKGWMQPGKNTVLIWRDSSQSYSYALRDTAILVCCYGGTIGVMEVNEKQPIRPEDLADKYYVMERIKIRNEPDGNQAEGDKALIAGAIVKVHKEREVEEVNGYTWIKIYYDINKTGWGALEFLDELPQPVKDYPFEYKWDSNENVTPELKDKAAGVSQALGINPDHLMMVMMAESGFEPSQKNLAGGSATGLIQMMPEVAKELNTTTEEIAKMSAVEQMDYVFGYFYPYKGKLNDLGDVYMRVLCPEAIGLNDGDVIYAVGTPEYEANSHLAGSTKTGITKNDAIEFVKAQSKKYKK